MTALENVELPMILLGKYDDKERKTGDLYIQYYLSFEKDKVIKNINKNDKILENIYVAKNCNIDDIFQNNI